VQHRAEEVYHASTLLSLAGDLRITRAVNGNQEIHLMLDKRYLNPIN
jgi:acetamidase/formamidase